MSVREDSFDGNRVRRWSIIVVLASVSTFAFAGDPHSDPTILPGRCNGCHQLHEMRVASDPFRSSAEVCLSCHGSPSRASEQISSGNLAANATPGYLELVSDLPFVLPTGLDSFSGSTADEVT